MSEMTDRVNEALHLVMMAYDMPCRDEAREEMVRAVFAAIREPTEEMLNAAQYILGNPWSAMVDVALGEIGEDTHG